MKKIFVHHGRDSARLTYLLNRLNYRLSALPAMLCKLNILETLDILYRFYDQLEIVQSLWQALYRTKSI